jgi:hypothetical protein
VKGLLMFFLFKTNTKHHSIAQLNDMIPCKSKHILLHYSKLISNVLVVLWDYCLRVCFISSPGPKVHVNYCHHLASVVCCLSSVVCKLFTFQASSPKPQGRLEPNLAGMFLGWSSRSLW